MQQELRRQEEAESREAANRRSQAADDELETQVRHPAIATA